MSYLYGNTIQVTSNRACCQGLWTQTGLTHLQVHSFTRVYLFLGGKVADKDCFPILILFLKLKEIVTMLKNFKRKKKKAHN